MPANGRNLLREIFRTRFNSTSTANSVTASEAKQSRKPHREQSWGITVMVHLTPVRPMALHRRPSGSDGFGPRLSGFESRRGGESLPCQLSALSP
jgi:hypothetical protein